MNKLILPSVYKGWTFNAPSSKSISQRVIAIALISQNNLVIKRCDYSNDSMAAQNIIKSFGAHCSGQNTVTCRFNQYKSIKKNHVPEISVGESGLGLRMFTPIISTFKSDITINGQGSLLKRPIDFMVEPLRQLGVEIQTNNGFAPITIKSQMQGGECFVDGSFGSQFITGLLLAAPYAQKDVIINVSNPTSLPYINMTISIMKQFGVEVEANDNYTYFKVKAGQKYNLNKYEVEGDWSSVAAHIVGAATTGEVFIKGMNRESTQADKAILEVLDQVGVFYEFNDNILHVKKKDLKPFTFDATNCPDLFPCLASLAANCSGESTIIGTQRLTHKESNRALTIKEEFEKMGVEITLSDNKMIIKGGSQILGDKNVESHNDHRIAMALSILALNANGKININDPECVNKSYPKYWVDLAVNLNLKDNKGRGRKKRAEE